ncbi:MAG: RpiB/LacA/LacB family sugar-phosphate isomerase [Thaumarchaeota archaeon]|jgi:ribose 5-phosphate isomerase B|nr:RpiB/LacA/LacB family sugar-phosphate isomerase [Candidatus Terraquivivens yellowstonensis]MCL7387635.1 RpiB/LacA/LacB family sugar-phosphate isomerase [Candidatus Terraquivivens yellowstonensis]MCL7392701.1 RpiB/LacA/LacB family sugar-phosphate isomerase [Candidatus Terraquivivens yellowstonensis]MCL7395437.1 RpiB/LacA/LacB family sugar-phosphate isomerase [Candidatus Terraquivivens yellowstonensis]MCL7398331.1 RpiB/LacA/LacB family sugar-phosphate isomerase [Candidatus Terraquivivens yello
MRIAVGSDERTKLTDFVIEELKRRGHTVKLYGALVRDVAPWPDVALEVAESILKKEADEGILFCWTGTGVTIAANKVPGIRAALCSSGEIAKGARKWNKPNILVMSLSETTEEKAKEILDAWFSTDFDPSEEENIKRLEEIERRFLRKE